MAFRKRQAPPNLRRKRSEEETETAPGETETAPDALPEPQAKLPRKGIAASEPVPEKRASREGESGQAEGDIFSLDAAGRLVSDDTQRVFTQLEIDTDKSHDHRAIWERNFAIGEKLRTGELEAGVYRGQGAYVSHMKQREDAIRGNKYTGLHGPLRGSQFARTTLRIDYNPEICKDYKETGYCGFGDTCKFLHDRSDYKAGWQIEKEWEEEQRRKQQALLKDKEKSERRLLRRNVT
eukprot:Gregarina_sp_Pseudo_9__3967@NODE_410_length_2896_cov_13_895695_g387_i0_p2_GENE_NODE_410_length_2896_cov_13_895695_g387_i0NODE_410_length_2896_cov_13_895695_g387_i0_p2_ORF_typecomplete_len237_score68_91zfCCCH/PF00642_24/1_7e09zf_CCCH_4/PF18345_1/0_00016zfCCCH_4/PF18044_1/0_0029zfCCCH_3/PF15663_5/0_015zfCCCH_8/PF18633_1/0_39Torus/PF16131_5/0_45zfCCCH_2/PF14608_6/0_63_NODE_410_length_2896_cov_13_895695_g387_i04471157